MFADRIALESRTALGPGSETVGDATAGYRSETEKTVSTSFAAASDVELYPKAIIGESVDDRVDGRVRDGEKMSGNVEQLEQPGTVAETLMGRVVIAEKVETQLKDVHRKPEHSVENDDGHERFDSLREQRAEMNILAINAFVRSVRAEDSVSAELTHVNRRHPHHRSMHFPC